ncbi:MAG: DNA-binding response regulator [Bacteroidales bacterium]|nr:MAG: DNA-binding response regulator [Bacteroidales bacterium]
MNKKRVVIIDDERPARIELAFLLTAFPEISIVGEADSIESAVAVIAKTKPDIVFLDIQLTGENGFDLLPRIAVDYKIIFVTAFNQYAIKAFDVNAADYLLKPVNPARLSISLRRLLEQAETERTEVKRFDFSDSIYVKLNNHTSKFIEISTISAITSVGNYSKLVTVDGNKYHVLKTLKQWEEELPTGYFARIHRSTIVNIKHVVKIENYSKTYNRAYLKNSETPLEISRSCFKNLKKANL